MRRSFEDICGLLCRHKSPDIVDARLVLDQNQTIEILGQRGQSWILGEVRIGWREFWYFEVVSCVWLHQIVLSCDHYRIAFAVGWEFIENACEVLPDFDGGVHGVISVEASIGREYEEQITIVPREVFMAEVVGELVIEVRPHCDVDVVFEIDEEVIEQFSLAFARSNL
jgi:hypothetical protein